jgi:glycosyltransferase involved in cell wall biosynthesis
MSTVMQATPLPLVSVVIPVYNAERYLGESLDTALAQDYGNVEIIAVDDGSTDGSASILASYGDRIRVLSQANAGPARARNAGIETARGEFVAFLDADDVWRAQKLRLQVEHLLANDDVGLVYNTWAVLDGEDPRAAVDFLAGIDQHPATDGEATDGEATAPTLPLDRAGSGWVYHLLLQDSIVHTSAAMVRRSLLQQVNGFDDSLRRGQDYDLWLRLSRHTPFHKLTAVLSAYRLHSHSITQQPTPVNYGAVVINRALEKWGTQGPDGSSVSRLRVNARLASYWHSFGQRHLDRGDLSIARSSLWQSCRLAPWRPGYWRQWLRACLAHGRRNGAIA